MKIIEIIPTLASGGAERFVVDLCNELSKMHDVTLLVLYKLQGKEAFYESEINKRVRVLSLDKGSGLSLRTLYKTFKIISDQKPDIVHVHTNAFNYIIPAIFCLNRPKYFVTIHNDAEKDAGGYFLGKIKRALFCKMIQPVTISQESQDSFDRYYGIGIPPMIVNGREVCVTPVSIEVQREFDDFKTNQHTTVVISVARLTSQKRPWVLAEVAKRLSEEGYNLSVVFLGGTRNDDEVLRRISDVNASNVYLIGERYNPVEYLQLANCFVLFSSFEGMPISLIEAFAAGCAPVCTPVGGIKNAIIDGVNGIKAVNLDTDSCYDALKRFLDMSKEEQTRLSKNAIQSYAKYSMKECALKYLDLFEKYNKCEN